MKWLFGSKQRGRTSKADLDHGTLRQLAAAGADLARPTDVVSYLYVPDERRAQEAGAELRLAGYSVEVRPSATGVNWLALARVDLVPSVTNIRLLRERFEGLAAKLGGEFDGWEAAVTK